MDYGITVPWLVVLSCFLSPKGWGVGAATVSHNEFPRLVDIPGYNQEVDGEDVYVETAQGRLMGRRREGDARAGGVTSTVDWFLGIPYAKPPTGDRRFKRPEEAGRWNGVLNATRFGWVCPQPPVYPYAQIRKQSEDCLYLNVYSPVQGDGSSGKLYPVMVFFHGGSNVYGSGSIYLGHLLAQHGVVVVTTNYRLGMLGFFCAREEGLRGNYGLHDQVQTLKWVHRHIRQFHGDPTRVTIFGNSAGGGDVGLLTLAPPARGLFKYAISQSGVPLAFWCMHGPKVNLSEHVRLVGAAFGCHQAELADMVQCMRKDNWGARPGWRLLSDMQDISLPVLSPTGDDFKPCVDDYLLPDTAENLLRDSGINAQAYMTGTTQDEWTRNIGWFLRDLFAVESHLDQSFLDGIQRTTFEVAMKHVATKRFNWPSSVGDLITQQYTSWDKVDDPIENRNQYVHFFTDMSMLAPTVRMAELMERRDVPVYLYTFNHHSEYTLPKWWKSYHTSELNFLFGSPFTGMNVDSGRGQEYTDQDRAMSTRMMTLWTNFAKHGKPTPDQPASSPGNHGNQGNQGNVSWLPYSAKWADYLAIDAPSCSMHRLNRHEKVRLWNDVIPALVDSSPRSCSPASSYTTGGAPHYWPTATWVLAGTCVVLLLIVLLCAAVLVRMKNKYNGWMKPGVPANV